MSREELFVEHYQPRVGNILPRNEADLSPIGDYVLGQMPADLRQLSQGEIDYDTLAAKHESLLREQAPLIFANQDPQVAKVIQMDLLFMFGGYIPAGNEMYQKAPPSLYPMIDQQCARFSDLQRFMTYDSVIDLNASEYVRTGNIRVYSDGKDASGERDFYIGHHMAEQYINQAARGVRDLALSPDLHDANSVLQAAVQDMATFKRYMQKYKELSNESFDYFRQYLASYADGTRNASGAFMPSVQLLELTLKKPSQKQVEFIDSAMTYFPDWSKPELEQWREDSENGINIESQLESGNLVLDAEEALLLEDLVNQFRVFRESHRKVTKGKIPQAFPKDGYDSDAPRNEQGEQSIFPADVDPDTTGTAGFDIPHVLGNSILRLVQLKERLRAGRTSE